MKQPTPWWMWLLPLPIVWWFALITVGVWRPGMDLMRLMEELSTALEQPWNIRWSEYSGRCLLLFSFVYAVAVGMVRSSVTATRRGEEHGSAHWGDVFGIARRYRDKRGGNLILTQHFTIGWDGYRHKHNINVLVVGGSGAEKHGGTVCRTYWRRRAETKMRRPVRWWSQIQRVKCCVKQEHYSLRGAMRCVCWT